MKSNFDSYRLKKVTITVTKGKWNNPNSEDKSRNIGTEEIEIKYSPKDLKKKKKENPIFVLYDYSKKYETPIIKVVHVENGEKYGLDESYEFEIMDGDSNNDDEQIKLTRLVSALERYYIVEITAEKYKMY